MPTMYVYMYFTIKLLQKIVVPHYGHLCVLTAMFPACAGYWEKVLLERSLQAHCSFLMKQNPCLLPSRSVPRLMYTMLLSVSHFPHMLCTVGMMFDFISPEGGFSYMNLSFCIHIVVVATYVFTLLWVSGACIVLGISITSQDAI